MKKVPFYFPGIIIEDINFLNKKSPGKRELPFLILLLYGIIDSILALIMAVIGGIIGLVIFSYFLFALEQLNLVWIVGIGLLVIFLILGWILYENDRGKLPKKVKENKIVEIIIKWDERQKKKEKA